MTSVWDLKSQFEKYQDNTDVFDCFIAESLLSEGRYAPTEVLAMEKYKASTINELAIAQREKLAEFPKLESLFADVEMPLVRVLWGMERTGITLDVEGMRKVGAEIAKAIILSEDEIKKDVGFDINLNSPQQVGTFLAEKAGVPLGKTKTGKYATNEQELQKFAEGFPIIVHLLKYRELTKLRSTYVESLIAHVDENGKVHTTYHQVAASTGRLASTSPNLQNIPVTSDFGMQIKACFLTSPGHTLLSFDYSQQELRILAHLTGEEKLIQAFREDRDVHKTTASQIFKVDYLDVTKQQRQVGKTINFGIIYGMSSYGMSEGLHIPVEEAQTFIDTFYATYPRIRTYYDNYLKQGQIDDVVETLFGRRRYGRSYPGAKFMDNATKRVLMNYPIQGTAADLMKMAMVKVQNELLDKNDKVHLILQIHDDLVFEVPEDEKLISELVPQIKELMCGVYPLAVPIEVDVKRGRRWGEMELLK